jgi:hypothetical protein
MRYRISEGALSLQIPGMRFGIGRSFGEVYQFSCPYIEPELSLPAIFLQVNGCNDHMMQSNCM